MIFVDANVPMYLVGASHPHKNDAARLLEQAAAGNERRVMSFDAAFDEVPGLVRSGG